MLWSGDFRQPGGPLDDTGQMSGSLSRYRYRGGGGGYIEKYRMDPRPRRVLWGNRNPFLGPDFVSHL